MDERASYAESPPHPRGSTRNFCTNRLQTGVSPAPAGIDPALCLIPSRAAGLPRTRGDRPVAPALAWDDRQSPPHPRGSTLHQANRRLGPAVSPAPAGIDPSRRNAGRRLRRLPRTRGDRPRDRVRLRRALESPPHPRGSTLGLPEHVRGAGVSPAPAGIDPRLRRKASAGPGLPRTRGDRPGSADREHPPARSPPHPRGSTPDRVAGAGAGRVSPAPAGIDPVSTV